MRKHNPMHIYTAAEAELILEKTVPEHFREENGIYIRKVDNNGDKGYPAYMFDLRLIVNAVERLAYEAGEEEAVPPSRLILGFSFPTTMKRPHLIERDGSVTYMQPGHGVPLRQYFDGSVIDRLGHAAMACVDFKAQTVTAQDPQGIPFEADAREALRATFRGFKFIDLQMKQQKDAHSCLPITLMNMVYFAHDMTPPACVDIDSLRAEYCRILDTFLPLDTQLDEMLPVHKLRHD